MIVCDDLGMATGDCKTAREEPVVYCMCCSDRTVKRKTDSLQKASWTVLEEVKADAEEVVAVVEAAEAVGVVQEQKTALLVASLLKSPMNLFARTSPEGRAVDVSLGELHLGVVETH